MTSQEWSETQEWLNIVNQMCRELDLNTGFILFDSFEEASDKIIVVAVNHNCGIRNSSSVTLTSTIRNLPTPSHSWILQVMSNQSKIGRLNPSFR